jgi:hypothetical protein
MRRMTKQVLSALLLGSQAVYADVEITEGLTLSGDVRAVYYAEDEGSGAESISGFGFNPTFKQSGLFSGSLTWELGGGFALPAGESAPGYGAEAGLGKAGDPAYGDPDAEDTKAYASLTRLNLLYDYGSGFVKIGYQTLETPMADSDDIRLVPNSYFAGIFAYTGIDNLTLMAAQVSHMAGVADSGSAESAENYHSMSDAALGGVAGDNRLVDDVGVTALAAVYADEAEGLSGQLWHYMMPDAGVQIVANDLGAVSASYLDVGMAFEPVTVTAQYMTFATDLWRNTAMGVQIEAELEGGFGLVVAMNSYTFSDKGIGSATAPAWYAWGGYPEFVAGEEVDASFADWDGGTAYLTGMSYGGVEGLELGVMYLAYSDRVDAVDATVKYSFSEQFSALAIHETKTYDDSTVKDVTTTEVKLFYTF